MLGPCALAARISVQGSVWRMRWDRAPLPGGLNKDGSVGSPSPMPALVLGPARGRILPPSAGWPDGRLRPISSGGAPPGPPAARPRWWRRLSVCRVPPHPPSPTRPATLSPAPQPCPAHPGPPQPVPGPAAIWRPAFQRRPRRATGTRASSLPRATNKVPGPGQMALRKYVQGDLCRMPHGGRGSSPDSERRKQTRINLLSLIRPTHGNYIYIYNLQRPRKQPTAWRPRPDKYRTTAGHLH